jgi:hypothetical protein
MVLGAAVIASPAAARRLCPPVAVVKADTCECKVHNYAAVADLGVAIAIYTDGGAATVCAPTSVNAKEAISCLAGPFSGQESCGCEVTGEGAQTRVSLSVVALNTSGNRDDVRASVECRP